MSNKGGTNKLKRIASSVARHLDRKSLKWTIKQSPGPHNQEDSIPLGFVIRDVLGLAANLKEARILLDSGKVSVDCVARKDYKFPVGIFDIVQISGINKAFRLVFEKHARLVAKEIKFAEKQKKVCRIVAKKMTKAKTILLSTNDGRSIFTKENDSMAKAKPGDSILLDVPDNKPKQLLEMKKGNTVFVFKGTHVSETAKIIDIAESTMQRPKLVTLESENEKYSTVAENIFVVGEEKSEIEY